MGYCCRCTGAQCSLYFLKFTVNCCSPRGRKKYCKRSRPVTSSLAYFWLVQEKNSHPPVGDSCWEQWLNKCAKVHSNRVTLQMQGGTWKCMVLLSKVNNRVSSDTLLTWGRIISLIWSVEPLVDWLQCCWSSSLFPHKIPKHKVYCPIRSPVLSHYTTVIQVAFVFICFSTVHLLFWIFQLVCYSIQSSECKHIHNIVTHR